MSKNFNLIFLYKIMECKFIDGFSKGNLYFSCCGNWIDIAKKTGGKGQGDLYEGVFAKYLKKNSRKPIQKYKKLFGNDLRIESDGEYRLLRRKSSLDIPAICFYSLDSDSLMEYFPDKDKEWIERILEENRGQEEITVEKFPLGISDKYLSEFNLKSEEIDAVTIQPRNLLMMFRENGIYYNKVAYIDKSSEFDIYNDGLFKRFFSDINEAIEKNIEIFFKDKNDYSHQCELRATIYTEHLKSIKRGITKHFDGLSYINVNENNPVNATGKDFICYTKSTHDGMYSSVVLKYKE